MALSDHLPKQVPRAPGKLCGVCWLLGRLEPAARDELVEAMESGLYSDRVLTEAICAEHKVYLSDQALGRHRRGRHDERSPDGSA